MQERIDKATAPGADREDVGLQMQGGEEQLVKVIKEPRSGIVRPLIGTVVDIGRLRGRRHTDAKSRYAEGPQ